MLVKEKHRQRIGIKKEEEIKCHRCGLQVTEETIISALRRKEEKMPIQDRQWRIIKRPFGEKEEDRYMVEFIDPVGKWREDRFILCHTSENGMRTYATQLGYKKDKEVTEEENK